MLIILFMICTLDEELGILTKYHLSPNEFFIIRVFFLLQEDGVEKYLHDFITIPENKVILRETLNSLQNKGIIVKSCKLPKEGETFDPYSIDFNKTFVKGFLKASFDIGKELFENYPMFAVINGQHTMLRTVSKKFNSLEDAYFAYGKAIGWNKEAHQRVIELVKWASENQLLNCSLASFIIDRRWLYLESMQSGDNCNINFNTVKDI